MNKAAAQENEVRYWRDIWERLTIADLQQIANELRITYPALSVFRDEKKYKKDLIDLLIWYKFGE
jgi:hypothetical protein